MADTELHARVHLQSETMARSLVTARQFKLQVDEPVSEGGKDEGPNPVEYLLAAQAGCLNYMCHWVARELKITIRSLEIDVDGQVDFAKCMGLPTDRRAGFESVNAVLRVETDADDDTLEEWRRRVESRCPVGDNVANATPLNVSVSATAPV